MAYVKRTGKKVEEKAAGTLAKEVETDSMKVARRLIEKRNLIDDARDAMDMIAKELIEAMKKENCSRLYVNGFTLTVKFKEAQQKVQIQKPRG